MTAQEIFDEIRMLGGRLEARGNRLHVDVPAGVLGPEHREALAAFKPELLALLQAKRTDAQTEPAEVHSSEDSWVWIEERAAILEIDGGMDRNTANYRAFMVWFDRFVGRTSEIGDAHER